MLLHTICWTTAVPYMMKSGPKKTDILQKFCINPFFTSAASYFLQVFKSLVFHPNQTGPVTSHQATPIPPNLSWSQPAQP
jgi:hypothetical protein